MRLSARPSSTLRARAARCGAVVTAATLLAPAAAGGAQDPASSQTPLRVTAQADASVAMARPHRPDRSAQLRVGGRARWRALLRFDARSAGPTAKAILGVWALSRPKGRIVVRFVRSKHGWRERLLTFARAPRLGAVTGLWRSGPRACPRHGARARSRARRCRGAGRWVWIDVTRAVGATPRVELALTARTRKAL